MRSLIIIIIIWWLIFGGYGLYTYFYPATTDRTTRIDTVPLLDQWTVSQAEEQQQPVDENPTEQWTDDDSTDETPTDEQPANDTPYNFEIVPVAEWLAVPWAVVETTPWRLLVTERAGRVRQIVDGELWAEPMLVLSQISNRAEEWLMSIILDPDYDQNAWVYLAYAQAAGGGMEVQVVRYTDQWDTLTDPFVVIGGLPAAQRHAWTALAFGPDGYLYVTVGDATDKQLAQSRDVYHGKILRITAQGEIPADNPIPDSAIWSLWHRNPQWIDRTSAGEMYSSEHWPSTFDGPPWGDEINRIVAWANYGRPVVSHERTAEWMVDPIAVYTPAIAPASLLIYSWSMFPRRQDQIFVGMLTGEWILKVQIDPQDPNRIIQTEKIVDDSYGRVRFVWQWSDWSLYFTTSNEDWRWDSRSVRDGVYQIRLQSQ